MSAGAAAAVAQGIASGYQIYNGIKQQRKGEKLEDGLETPVYNTPKYAKQNLAMALNSYREGIGAAEENAYFDNVANAEASTINNFRSRKGELSGAAIAAENRRKANTEFLIRDVQQRQENQRQLYRQRQNMTDYADKEFQINTLDPFGRNLNYARELQATGKENINRAVQTMASSAINYQSGRQNGIYGS